MNCEWRDVLDYFGATVYYCERDGTQCISKCEHYKEFKINEKIGFFRRDINEV